MNYTNANKLAWIIIAALIISGCNKDESKYKIRLNGKPSITIMQGESFTDPGAKVTGAKTGIQQFSNVDTSRPGTYGITYSVTDKSGKVFSVGRTVKVIGTNILEKSNPHIFKDNLNLYQLNGAVYTEDSHKNDGSGSIMLKGQGKDVYSKAVTTPPFKLEKGKRYTMSAYIKMVGAARGQNIFFKISAIDNDGKTVEVLYNIAEPNEWEEVILPYRAEVSGKYVFHLFIHKYGYSTDGKLIKKDLSNMAESPAIYYDDFSVVESDGVFSREPTSEKTPFESSIVKIDKLGNWSIKANGTWTNIFPRFAYQTWLDGFAENAARYKEYGFTGYANITDINKLKTALDIGLKYNCIQINKLDKPFVADVLKAIKDKSIPATAIIMYQHDNETTYMGQYDTKKEIAAWIDKNDKDTLTGKRTRPIFVLNGVGEGLARNMKSSHCNFMDLTGSYIGQHGEDTDIRYNPVNTLEMLNNIDKQTAPVSIIQMQAYYLKTFVPMLFKGIIQGGRGLKFWRGGTTHNGSKNDFRENSWAPAIKGEDGVFARIDKMLPIIREPLAEEWSAVIPQKVAGTVAIGKRTHNGKHYLILANFADSDQTVEIALGGIYVTEARDFFTKEKIADINNGVFNVTIGHFNDGYKVIELDIRNF
jgi:hypothetical protein